MAIYEDFDLDVTVGNADVNGTGNKTAPNYYRTQYCFTDPNCTYTLDSCQEQGGVCDR